MKPHEILLCVNIPYTRRFEYVKEFKQSPRREDDIAIVNAGMRVRMERTADGESGPFMKEACVSVMSVNGGTGSFMEEACV